MGMERPTLKERSDPVGKTSDLLRLERCCNAEDADSGLPATEYVLAAIMEFRAAPSIMDRATVERTRLARERRKSKRGDTEEPPPIRLMPYGFIMPSVAMRWKLELIPGMLFIPIRLWLAFRTHLACILYRISYLSDLKRKLHY